MKTKIYISYSRPQDEPAKDIIRGKFMLEVDEDVEFVTSKHLAKECNKALVLVGDNSVKDNLLSDISKLEKSNVPFYITKIHKNQKTPTELEFSEYKVHDWSLDQIVEFCIN